MQGGIRLVLCVLFLSAVECSVQSATTHTNGYAHQNTEQSNCSLLTVQLCTSVASRPISQNPNIFGDGEKSQVLEANFQVGDIFKLISSLDQRSDATIDPGVASIDRFKKAQLAFVMRAHVL